MKCPMEKGESAELLLDYCSRRLDAARERELEGHIRSCAGCREFVARQRAVWNALDGWEAPPVSADFDRRLYGRIQEQVSWWDLVRRPLRPVLLRRGLPIAVTAGLVIVAGLLFQGPAELPAPTAPKSAKVMEGVSADQVERAVDDMEMLRDLNRLVRADNPESKM
jgi:anti-sigma factor RsiW